MNADEYAAQQAVISAAIARYVMQLGRFFLPSFLSMADWLGFLELLFPEVYDKRLEAARLAREFYDSERERHGRPRDDRYLVEYDFPEFVKDMEPVRREMQRENADESALGAVALRTVRSVENAGRKQIIRAVEDTPDPPGMVQGWARVATGDETCAWCLMLISRGPVYHGADTAGLDLPDDVAAQMIAAGQDVSEYMEQWHDGCDCKVVPVYDLKNWPGYDAFKRAEQLWIEATREAQRLIDSGEARSRNLNREAQNALRRRLERGDIRMSEFALAA